jgi:hypothetical protein
MRAVTTTFLLGLSLATGCARDLRSWVETSNTPSASRSAADEAELATEGSLDTGADLSVVTTVLIDATDYESFVHYDFERQGLVDAELPWDMRWQRYVVALNGGHSGEGEGAAQFLAEVPFDEVVEAPEDGWVVDAEDADGDGVDELAMNEWYDYDVSTHVLSPKPGTWLLRSAEGAHFKVELLDYYDDAGTPGMVSLRWAELDPPATQD